MIKFFFVVFSFFFSFLFFFAKDARASNEFSSAYDLTFEVKNDAKTFVLQNIHLTNLTTNYYASEYTLILGTDKIEQIEAFDGQGPLKIKVEKNFEQTKIHVQFNEKIVGLGKILNWTLKYQSLEIAKKLGRIWEINIPRLSAEENPTFYNVSLLVPPVFNEPAYVFPQPKNRYYWTLHEGSKDGISLAFGDWQGFKFDLNYHLENKQLLSGKTEIALPADTPYQKIILKNINPKPKKIRVDHDGNWLAEYFLLPKQKLDVKVSGSVKIFAQEQPDYPKDDGASVYHNYLKTEEFWEQNEKIKELAKQLKTPREIYDYVIKTLNYDYERANQETKRLGAAAILTQPQKAICMEFTDLFIALARSSNLPAREVDGFAYTSNSKLKPLSLVTDVLHSWPEYWDKDKNLWVQIDPTWGKTSQMNYFDRFDFNHFAFVIRGLSSKEPYPAGSYRSQSGGKDVLVEFSDDIPQETTQNPKVEIVFPKKYLAGLPLKGKVIISNPNRTALYNLKPSLNSSFQIKNHDLEIPILPPQAEKIMEIEIPNNDFFLNALGLVTLSLDGRPYTARINIISLPLLIIPLVILIVSLGFLLCHVGKKIWTRIF
ncbi:MAG: transglutaminase-like domain-containing protein [Patescibacteria group bacterium]|nr:transglutaminase-like domain-containing protein [Patescibacteria group bacterium]